jgi:hypothetical protein
MYFYYLFLAVCCENRLSRNILGIKKVKLTLNRGKNSFRSKGKNLHLSEKMHVKSYGQRLDFLATENRFFLTKTFFWVNSVTCQ